MLVPEISTFNYINFGRVFIILEEKKEEILVCDIYLLSLLVYDLIN